MDEATYVLDGRLGQPSGRVAITRSEIEQARRTGRPIFRSVGDWSRVEVDLERTQLSLMADDRRLGRE